MMKKAILIIVAVVAAAMTLVSCNNNDIKPKRPIIDQPGILFVEGGKRDTINTDISTEQLKQALVENDWEFSYSFFYDDYKIGKRGEDLYLSRYIYTYNTDGTAVATDLSDGKTYNYNYTVTARTVTLTSPTAKFTIGVMGLDKTHMVADESLKGQVMYEYDAATLTRRLIFLARKKH